MIRRSLVAALLALACVPHGFFVLSICAPLVACGGDAFVAAGGEPRDAGEVLEDVDAGGRTDVAELLEADAGGDVLEDLDGGAGLDAGGDVDARDAELLDAAGDVADAHVWGPTCFAIVQGANQGACGGPWFAQYGMVAVCGASWCCNEANACASADVARCGAGACAPSSKNLTCSSDAGPICCEGHCP